MHLCNHFTWFDNSNDSEDTLKATGILAAFIRGMAICNFIILVVIVIERHWRTPAYIFRATHPSENPT